MITKQTTLILGAGASKPYHFPTGQELRNKIINNTLGRTNDGWESEFDNYSDINIEDVRKFGCEFEQSPLSIDAFLECRQEFLEIGKWCIALALISEENPGELLKNDKGKWYGYLFRKLLTQDIRQITANRLSIVTFNYDRSIDYFLINSLKHSFNVNEMQCLEILNGIMPMHVYGKLGDLPCQNLISRSYMQKFIGLNIAVNGIDLISERERERDKFVPIWHSINESERIYFLGFGYDETNLERLAIKESVASIIKGSSFGLGGAEKRSISAKWNIGLPDDSNGDVLHFLKNYVYLD